MKEQQKIEDLIKRQTEAKNEPGWESAKRLENIKNKGGGGGGERGGGILLMADSVMALMGFCHFLSLQCLLNRGLCIQKDH